MCGIIGIANKNKKVSDELVFGLKNMEYRGYDSAGLIFGTTFKTYKSIGSIETLEKISQHNNETIGIAHTRWATHGKVCLENTHPIKIGRYAIVHNGIIEDTDKIIQTIGYIPKTQTDTEILLAYFTYLIASQPLENALKDINNNIRGSYAAAIIEYKSNNIIWLKKGFSPLILAETTNGNCIASDIEGVTNAIKMYEINTNGYGLISSERIEIIEGTYKESTLTKRETQERKRNYNTWLEEEIHQQISLYEKESNIETKQDFSNYTNIKVIGCGSSFFAAELGAIWLEEEGYIASASLASEWNISKTSTNPKQLAIFISQSGFTADTLSALLKASKYCNTMSIVNQDNSPIASNSDKIVMLNAGKEKSVAASKSFSSQIIKLHQIIKGPLPQSICSKIKQTFEIDLDKIANVLATAQEIFILGKNKMHIIAKEGALKIIELAYLNVFAYAAGELKHGYIAKITEQTYSIILAPEDTILLNKTISTAQEILSRKGKVIWISAKNYINTEYFIKTEKMDYDEATFNYTIILQKLALKIAQILNKPIDKPRNLAKSVTVE